MIQYYILYSTYRRKWEGYRHLFCSVCIVVPNLRLKNDDDDEDEDEDEDDIV